VQSFSPTFQNCYKLFINSNILKKKVGLCADMVKIKLLVNALNAEGVSSKNSLPNASTSKIISIKFEADKMSLYEL